MKAKQKTYMVAITKIFKIQGLTYFEAIATNYKDAERQAKAAYKKQTALIDQDLFDDALYTKELGDNSSGKTKIFSVGNASLYHSEAECKLCRKVKS